MPEVKYEYRHRCACTDENGIRILESQVGNCIEPGVRDERRRVVVEEWEPV